MVTWLDYCSQRARRFPSSSFSRKLAKQLQEGGIITGGWSEPREVSASGRKGEAVRLGFGVHARDVAERRLEDACIREGGAYGIRKTVVSEWRFDQTSSTKGEDVRPEGGQADDVCQDVVVGSYSVEGQGGCQGENQKCTSSHDDELNLLLTKRKQDKNKKNKKKKRLIGGSWNVLVLLEMTNYLTYADAAAHTNLTFLLREERDRETPTEVFVDFSCRNYVMHMETCLLSLSLSLPLSLSLFIRRWQTERMKTYDEEGRQTKQSTVHKWRQHPSSERTLTGLACIITLI